MGNKSKPKKNKKSNLRRLRQQAELMNYIKTKKNETALSVSTLNHQNMLEPDRNEEKTLPRENVPVELESAPMYLNLDDHSISSTQIMYSTRKPNFIETIESKDLNETNPENTSEVRFMEKIEYRNPEPQQNIVLEGRKRKLPLDFHDETTPKSNFIESEDLNETNPENTSEVRFMEKLEYGNLKPQQNIVLDGRKRKLPLDFHDGTQNKQTKKQKHVAEEQPYEITFDNCDDEVGNIITGHRIIDIQGFLSELQEISTHESLFDCGLSTLKIDSEKRKGLHSVFNVSCQLCKKTFKLKNSSENLNKGAVSGIMAAGCGNAELNQFIAAMDLPNISDYTYNRVQDEVCNEWELTAWDEMIKAAQKEKEAAIREGKVDKDGIPLLDVVLDGCWSKRSYRTNYSAPSGAAAIIGRRFGQVLFMSVKNKYCCICARANKNNETVKEHSCYKNFDGPSTAMEASIIVEGFKQSIEMHGCIYSRFIADGDSNTYTKILESRPYKNRTVEKIYCKNHILRNFCNKLQFLKTDTRYGVGERKLLTDQKILSARKYITNCIELHHVSKKPDRVDLLHKDITGCLKHGFGSHDDCNREICNRKNVISHNNYFKCNLWYRMQYIVNDVAKHARSLVENVDSNIVECFNSVIAKFIGGKRVNYALRRSYQARCAGALVSFNTGNILSTVHQNFNQEPVRENLLQYEVKKQKKREYNRKCQRKTKKIFRKTTKTDINYGENADTPDMDTDVYEQQKELFLKNLLLTDQERREIEKRTTLQAESGEWLELRRNLLTASNFGKVVKRIEKNSCQNIVKNMLYKANLDHVPSVAHGKKNEHIAIEQLATLHNINIEKCGLFIDEKHSFLGATPDGVINDDMLLEVKCPVAPFKIGIDEAIVQGKVQLWRIKKDTGEVYVNRKSDWFMQAQGQMHIAKKQKCLFAVWYGENKIRTEIIEKDDNFWYTVMEPKLIKFYFDCLLPELVDPRFTRKRPIRDPPYVVQRKKKEVADKENA